MAGITAPPTIIITRSELPCEVPEPRPRIERVKMFGHVIELKERFALDVCVPPLVGLVGEDVIMGSSFQKRACRHPTMRCGEGTGDQGLFHSRGSW